uniref:Organic cation transporter protein-like n=1 Tax=Crassostrea virginica TaxID=6565 RepID=A0A8B8DQ74_CRAVI|nr:organic cation transporter protein-like [Crassostrea virginica]XP_022329708.1 organic cation transporter protein-like [Crassostrea virginica]XP_022329709.1 organic cation transporter protein-like [Crassostrea virginica]XP_022329710.1 organic cation transporter protein-like [Crassostrea virginica]
MYEFENVLSQLGSFGAYQRRVFVLVSMFETPVAWAMLLPIFLNVVPEWECPGSSSNVSTSFNSSSNSNITLPKEQCTGSGSVCPGAVFSGDLNTIVSEWSLVCDRKYVPSTITTVQMCGLLVGALVCGQLADIFGRRKLLYITYTLLLAVSLGSAFVNSWQLFAAFRFFIGGLVGSVMVVNFVLPLEFVTPSWRTFCGCVGFWAVGLMTLAIWGYLISEWRYLIIGTSVSGVFMLFSWWFVPESPRWLLSKGRFDEAEAILKTIAKYNNIILPDLSTLKKESEIASKPEKRYKNFSYWHLFQSCEMSKNSLIVMYGWFVSSSVYYGLNFNTGNLAGNLYLNVFISGLVEIPALVYVVALNNRIGRRKITLSLMLLAGISCLAVLVVTLIDESQTVLIIVIAMIGKSAISGGWAATQVFSAETFPTVIRNIGIGACAMSARIGGIAAPQIVRLSKGSLEVLPFPVFGGLALLCGFLMLCLPETKNKPLKDHIITVPDPEDLPEGGSPEEIPLRDTPS